MAACTTVERRAAQTLEWVKPQNWILDIALDHLTLARCDLLHTLLAGGDRDALAQARRLIAECGYRRREPELADAEAYLAQPFPLPLVGEG